MNIMYYPEFKSKDSVGILLKEEDADGRVVLSKQVINGYNYVRVKSFATNDNPVHKNILCGDEIAHNSVLRNDLKDNEEVVMDGEKIIVEKFSHNKHSNIGIAFGTSITEQITQAKFFGGGVLI